MTQLSDTQALILSAAAQRLERANRELTAEAAEAGQTYRVAFAFGEDQPENLLPGASATVQVTVQRPGSDSVVTLPASALRYAPDGRPQVLVYRPDDADPDRGTLASTEWVVLQTRGEQLGRR